MGVGSKGYTEGSSQTKVCKLEVSLAVDEQVLGLEITVEDSVAMAVANAGAKLAHELLDHGITETKATQIDIGTLRKSLATTAVLNRQGLHVLLQVEVQELEDEVEFVAIGMNNVEQTDDVGVAHLLEEGDLSDGSAGNTLILGLETDFLQSYNATTIGKIPSFIDDTVGT